MKNKTHRYYNVFYSKTEKKLLYIIKDLQMFKFLKNIFNPGGTVDKTLDLIDKGKFTPQEKADYTKNYFKEKLNLSATTRRYLAWSITVCYLVAIMPMFLVAFWNMQKAKGLLELLNDSHLGGAFWSVVGLFFGLGLLNLAKKEK